MDIFDQILENLELERDLGTRSFEMDRALLNIEPLKDAETQPPAPSPQPPMASTQSPRDSQPATPTPQSSVSYHPSSDSQPSPPNPSCDILFLTGRPLSEAGMDAMNKTFAFMRKTKPDISIAIDEKRSAKAIVLLGSSAAAKHMPGGRAARGTWTAIGGVPAIMTFSPDFIFNSFRPGSPGMLKAKKDMWNDIQSAMGRV